MASLGGRVERGMVLEQLLHTSLRWHSLACKVSVTRIQTAASPARARQLACGAGQAAHGQLQLQRAGVVRYRRFQHLTGSGRGVWRPQRSGLTNTAAKPSNRRAAWLTQKWPLLPLLNPSSSSSYLEQQRDVHAEGDLVIVAALALEPLLLKKHCLLGSTGGRVRG